MKTQLTFIITIFLYIGVANAQFDCTMDETIPVGNIGVGDNIFPPPPPPPPPGPPPPADDITWRMVYWIHGLNGDGAGWLKPAEAFERGYGVVEARKIVSQRVDYELDQSVGDLFSVASSVDKDLEIHPNLINLIEQEDPSKEYNPRAGIIFAHSQGGIVSRKIDKEYSTGEFEEINQKYGGIVTFGSANQGAQIINNKNDVYTFLANFSNKMSAGPISSLLNHQEFLIRIVSRKVLKPQVRFELEKIFTLNTTNYLLGENYPPITEQYKVGAPDIDELNSYTPNGTHLVAFYGIREPLTYKENAIIKNEYGNNVNIGTIPVPISWATINYFINKPSEIDYFKAQEEEYHVAGKAHLWYLDYHNKETFHNNKVDELKEPFLGFIFNRGKIKRHENQAGAWGLGVDFLENFDEMYRGFIGALDYRTVTSTITTCDCKLINLQDGGVEMDLGSENLEEGEICGKKWEYLNSNVLDVTCTQTQKEITRLIVDTKPSDGVVLAESQMEIPQRTWNPQLMEGSTHMGMRNDEALRIGVDRIFEGGVGNFFATEKKD